MNILVTGGAGYIGSFMTKVLIDKGHRVTVVDSLERGHKEALHSAATFIQGNLLDSKFVEQVFSENTFDGIIHFAGVISMAESMKNPFLYFQDNINASLNILEATKDKKIPFIFSSTAGVYGNPEHTPIEEDHPKKPTNPYGESKLIVEQILAWYNKIHETPFVVLRYFNAAGAALDGSLGEDHDPETHIIPLAIRAVLENSEFTLFGTDYDTPDGTCIRDYIHVLDLVEAHVLSLEFLKNKGGCATYNVGTGHGSSNKEVIEVVKKVTGVDFSIKTVDKRPGDANVLVADSGKIQTQLGFKPQYSDLETIVKTAWEWHQKLKTKNEK